MKDRPTEGKIQQNTTYTQQSNGIITKDQNIYLDQFASNQRSPVKGLGDFSRDTVEQTKTF